MIGILDCSTGVSGDKFLGALLDAGRPDGIFTAEHITAALSSIAPEARVVVEPVLSHGIAGCSVRVEATSEPPLRTWPQVREAVGNSQVPPSVVERALAAFELLALVEARIHNRPVDEVHFHEIGALDTIMDIVGTCLGLHLLKVDELVVTPVAVGGGTVMTAHGLLPVPAPATAALLLGVPTAMGPLGETSQELTTPTGAALVRACADSFGAWPAMTARWIGYGAGTRDIGCANVCRIAIGERVATTTELHEERVTVLESNIDHITPEAAAFAAEQLLGEGALDAWISPIVMKKGRAAFTLSALTTAGAAESAAARMMELTGTLGVRSMELGRLAALRESQTIDTPYGPVRFKIGAGAARPEADDVARIARTTHRSFTAITRELAEYAPRPAE